jgi:hypothetical protein
MTGVRPALCFATRTGQVAQFPDPFVETVIVSCDMDRFCRCCGLVDHQPARFCRAYAKLELEGARETVIRRDLRNVPPSASVCERLPNPFETSLLDIFVNAAERLEDPVQRSPRHTQGSGNGVGRKLGRTQLRFDVAFCPPQKNGLQGPPRSLSGCQRRREADNQHIASRARQIVCDSRANVWQISREKLEIIRKQVGIGADQCASVQRLDAGNTILQQPLLTRRYFA